MLAGEARQQLQFIIFIFTSRRSQEPAKLQNGGSSFAIPLHFFSLPEQIRAGKKEETAGRSQLGGWGGGFASPWLASPATPNERSFFVRVGEGMEYQVVAPLTACQW